MRRTHGDELAHIPDVELAKDWEKDMDVNDVVTVSGASIQAYHDKHTDEDAYFKTTVKDTCDTPGQCPPPVSDVYGGKEFRITVAHRSGAGRSRSVLRFVFRRHGGRRRSPA